VGRVGLDQETDLGELIISKPAQGLRFHEAEGKVSAVAWSDQELAVSYPYIYELHEFYSFTQAFECHDKFLRVLFISPVSHIRDAAWLDDRSYVLTFSVSKSPLHVRRDETYVLTGPL
jgi:hypothetical protein